MMKYILLILVPLMFISCHRRSAEFEKKQIQSAQNVVRLFVETSASARVGSDRQKMEALCTGELRWALKSYA